MLRRSRVRRAKLYFIRRKAAREAKRAMRKQLMVEPLAKDEAEDIVPSSAPQADLPQGAEPATEKPKLRHNTRDAQVAKLVDVLP